MANVRYDAFEVVPEESLRSAVNLVRLAEAIGAAVTFLRILAGAVITLAGFVRVLPRGIRMRSCLR